MERDEVRRHLVALQVTCNLHHMDRGFVTALDVAVALLDRTNESDIPVVVDARERLQ